MKATAGGLSLESAEGECQGRPCLEVLGHQSAEGPEDPSPALTPQRTGGALKRPVFAVIRKQGSDPPLAPRGHLCGGQGPQGGHVGPGGALEEELLPKARNTQEGGGTTPCPPHCAPTAQLQPFPTASESAPDSCLLFSMRYSRR